MKLLNNVINFHQIPQQEILKAVIHTKLLVENIVSVHQIHRHQQVGFFPPLSCRKTRSCCFFRVCVCVRCNYGVSVDVRPIEDHGWHGDRGKVFHSGEFEI